MKQYYFQKNTVIGPKAIILSSSLGSCSVLEDLSKRLFSSTNKKINIVVAYESISVQHTIVSETLQKMSHFFLKASRLIQSILKTFKKTLLSVT